MPVHAMKVRDVITNWPAKRWAADDDRGAALLHAEPNELRLRWFSTPDSEGWFRMMATDWEQREWSTYCRVDDLSKWPVLEITLSAKLHASLEEIDGLELRDSRME
jgi:hypothetical protein